MNPCQRIQLERIKLGSFNSFDGDKVAADLEEHENLYRAFLFGRFDLGNLIELRDLDNDIINADTIMFLTTNKQLKPLLKLIEKWGADEVGYTEAIKGDTSGGEYPRYKHVGTAPFCAEDAERDLCMAMGSTLQVGQIIIRAWWD